MNEVIAKKVKFAAVMLISIGAVLGIGCIISFIASALNEFAPDFLWTCITTGSIAATIIVMGIRNTRLPEDLILANEECFIFTTTGEQIPYAVICSVKSKYSDRKIIISTIDGNEHFIDYVAKYNEVKLLIAQKVKEKTGRDIIIC